MELYLGIKLLHILSATLLFGTGLGTAFFMLQAYRSDDTQILRKTAETVVVADWLFTTPAVVLQIATGLWLTHRLGIPYDSLWFIAVIGLFILVGICWLPVVWIQIRVRNRLRSGSTIDDCRPMMRSWIALGIPAFGSVVVIFGLMVYKPWLHLTW
jgi:uncharacterized membrane protein